MEIVRNVPNSHSGIPEARMLAASEFIAKKANETTVVVVVLNYKVAYGHQVDYTAKLTGVSCWLVLEGRVTTGH